LAKVYTAAVDLAVGDELAGTLENQFRRRPMAVRGRCAVFSAEPGCR
jgi:hypothetical protein